MEKTVVYDKLIRDKIPQIIAMSGNTCTTRVLDREEYLQRLDDKLQEELLEYQQSKDPEELADLLEVMEAVAAARGIAWEDILRIKEEKRAKRGGFEKRLLLQKVTETDE